MANTKIYSITRTCSTVTVTFDAEYAALLATHGVCCIAYKYVKNNNYYTVLPYPITSTTGADRYTVIPELTTTGFTFTLQDNYLYAIHIVLLERSVLDAMEADSSANPTNLRYYDNVIDDTGNYEGKSFWHVMVADCTMNSYALAHAKRIVCSCGDDCEDCCHDKEYYDFNAFMGLASAALGLAEYQFDNETIECDLGTGYNNAVQTYIYNPFDPNNDEAHFDFIATIPQNTRINFIVQSLPVLLEYPADCETNCFNY